jgi:spore germination protein YaaH
MLGRKASMTRRRKKRSAFGGWGFVLLLLVAAGGYIAYEKLIPSYEVMPLTHYYKLKDNEVAVVLQNKRGEINGLSVDGKIYIDYETVSQKLNHRFYWDSKEKLLTYTTPTEIIRVGAESNTCTITKSIQVSKAKAEYPLVKVSGEKAYIALDFVQRYSNIKYQYYQKPNRIVISYIWGDVLSTETKETAQIRKASSIKSPILEQLTVGKGLVYADTDEAPSNGFSKVVTQDGVIGYVKDSQVKQSFYKTLKNDDYKAPNYTAITRKAKINIGFHQIFNKSAAYHLEALVKTTKGMNVISPTFFRVKDTSGAIESFVTKTYVQKARSLGLEVWGLVTDVDKQVNMCELMSSTTSRDTLSNALVEYAVNYKLNGINVDFEQITSDAGAHYIQFLRELSVKCRNNGLILSVDSYVPSAYTKYYDREEQGKIVDYVVVMAYDENNASSEKPGPGASLGFVQEAVMNIVKMVPKEKVIIAVPFYARLWRESSDGSIRSKTYPMSAAAAIVAKYGGKPEWNDTNGCYYAEFQKNSNTFQIWMEEEKSITQKMKVIYNANVAGAAYWKLGLEKPDIWNIILKYNH